MSQSFRLSGLVVPGSPNGHRQLHSRQREQGHLGLLASRTATKLCLLAPPVIQLLALSPPPHPSLPPLPPLPPTSLSLLSLSEM